jgi:GNAT superfamily N-acetyltransferase
MQAEESAWEVNERKLASAHAALVAGGVVVRVGRSRAEQQLWVDCEIATFAENLLGETRDAFALDEPTRKRWEIAMRLGELRRPSRRKYETCYWIAHGHEHAGTLSIGKACLGDVARVYSVYVRPQFRRQRIMTGALDALWSQLEARGLGLRIHANQLGPGPGALLAAELGAASADHLSHVTDGDVDALAGAGVVATLLPGVEFSTRTQWAPARRLLDAGVVVALASDCNPGTSYTTSMPMVVAWACREYRMTPDEAVWAATAGGARALALEGPGALSPGGPADLAVLDAPSHVHLAYRPAVPLVGLVVRAGRVVYSARGRV